MTGVQTCALPIYNESTTRFIELSQFPGEATRFQSGFVIGDKLYVGTGRNAAGLAVEEFWEYDLVSGVWTPRANYPGGPMSEGTAFAISGKGYMGFGTPNQRNLYEYDPTIDIWSLKCQIPDLITGIENDRYGLASISAGGKAILGLGRNSIGATYGDMYSFDPDGNMWERITGLPPGVTMYYSTMVTDGEFGFIIGGVYQTTLEIIKFKISDL